MNAVRVLALVRIVMSSLFLWMVLAGNWVNYKNESFSVFDSSGGSGFGVVVTILGVLMVIISLLMLSEHEIKLGKLAVGGGQILLILSVAAFTTILSFLIIVHSGAFRDLSDVRGAGWGAAGACLTAYMFPQVVIMGIAFLGEATSTSLKDQDKQIFSFVTLVSGIVVVISPLFKWFGNETEVWSGYEPGAPRMGFLLLLLGVGMALVGAMRLRSKGLAEPGGRLSHPHLQIVAGMAIASPVLGWIITNSQREDFSIGFGPWLALVAGITMTGSAAFELTRREVTAG